MSPLRIADGAILAYRLFDIAYAVDLARAEALWHARPGAGSARRRLTTATPSSSDNAPCEASRLMKSGSMGDIPPKMRGRPGASARIA